MIDITKEQIVRLEKAGLAVVVSIEDEYNALKSSADNNKKAINELFSEFNNIVNRMNEEEVHNAD